MTPGYIPYYYFIKGSKLIHYFNIRINSFFPHLFHLWPWYCHQNNSSSSSLQPLLEALFLWHSKQVYTSISISNLLSSLDAFPNTKLTNRLIFITTWVLSTVRFYNWKVSRRIKLTNLKTDIFKMIHSQQCLSTKYSPHWRLSDCLCFPIFKAASGNIWLHVQCLPCGTCNRHNRNAVFLAECIVWFSHRGLCCFAGVLATPRCCSVPFVNLFLSSTLLFIIETNVLDAVLLKCILCGTNFCQTDVPFSYTYQLKQSINAAPVSVSVDIYEVCVFFSDRLLLGDIKQ